VVASLGRGGADGLGEDGAVKGDVRRRGVGLLRMRYVSVLRSRMGAWVEGHSVVVGWALVAR